MTTKLDTENTGAQEYYNNQEIIIKNKKDFNVIDTFSFGGEIEILKLRIDYLADSVDYFVFAESTRTHSGQPKNLVYPENLSHFEKWKHKIHYIVYDPDITEMNFIVNKDDVFSSDFFKLERGQRNALREKVIELANDKSLILNSDLDEFPDKNKFGILRELTKDLELDIISLNQQTYYYAPTNLLCNTWFGTVAFNYNTLIGVPDYYIHRENRFKSQNLENAGFHLSFFLTPERIKNKIETYVHQEYNTSEITDLSSIKKNINLGLDVLRRSEIIIKKLDKIPPIFPIEFYRHDFIFTNTFDREYLKPQQISRKRASMQIRLEIENLQIAVANHKPKVIVEIGTANGGTLARWLEIPDVQTVISIDYPVGVHGGQGFEERTYVISDAIEQANLSKKEFFAINGNSKDPFIVNRLEELLNGHTIDFLFIDGDHTYEGVKNDFKIYEKFLSDDALVGFHDIIDSEFHRKVNCFVSSFWKELKGKYKTEEFIYTSLLDPTLTEHFADTISEGGFGGIGLVHYSKAATNNNISLIVPIYNNVDNAINNIKITTSYSKLIDEIILYSNGSSHENNKKLIDFANTDRRVNLIIEQNAIGFIKAVNNSLKIAKNELILCLNSDAYLYFDWENRLIDFCMDDKYGIVGPLMVRDFILGCATIFKKSVINKIGMLDEGFGLGYEDDVEYSNRVKNNDYMLGFCEYKQDFDLDTSTNFPIVHVQGQSFNEFKDQKSLSQLVDRNGQKRKSFDDCNDVVVLKDLRYDDILGILNDTEKFIVINKSGDNFEKIRYDERIIELAKILECTEHMEIDEIISSITKNKTVTIIDKRDYKKDRSLTWLAKFDDFSSMGILSQRILEKLKVDFSCKKIIGETETNNKIILDALEKKNNYDLGIMFSYPDIYHELDKFKTKVIYTGIDSTGGTANFVSNIMNADYILTPSKKSKDGMISLGVKRPIYVFPHGIDTKLFKFKERGSREVFKFLYVGECSDRKGIFQLLDAFISLFQNNSNVELHIRSNSDMLFYNGNDVEQIKSKHTNIHWYIINQGHDSIVELYNSSHVYVYPSRADSFGMTLIEAMACGLPIISTDAPGATEIISGRYYSISSKLVTVSGHPWMLGQWSEPAVESLKSNMLNVFNNYEDILKSGSLKENSDFIRENLSWEKVVSDFEHHILPKLKKEIKIITLLTSYNRPHHIEHVIKSLKNIREEGILNDIYIVENSDNSTKNEIIEIINNNIDDRFKLYISDFNMGQRGALLQMLEDINIEDYDYIQFTDQDNDFLEPLSTYCDILREYNDIYFVTGYMSKEHNILGSRDSNFGKLYEKKSMRAGHMLLSVANFKKLLPIHLDSQFGMSHNSSWNAGLDWELTYWNKNAPAKYLQNNFILCVPGGVIHKGYDSTIYNWNVEENEYTLEELKEMRKITNG